MPRIAHHYRRPVPAKRSVLPLILLALTSLFVVANIVVWVVYHNRTYPRTKVINNSVGNLPFASLGSRVSQLKPVPERVHLTYGSVDIPLASKDLGISQDTDSLVASAKRERSWLPIADLFTTHYLAAPIAINTTQLASQTPQLAANFTADPQAAHLELRDGVAAVVDAKAGYRLDASQLGNALRDSLSRGRTTLKVPVHTLTARSDDTLRKTEQQLNAQLNTKLALTYAGKTINPSRADIAGWYKPANQRFVISEDLIISYLTNLGVQANVRFTDTLRVASQVTTALQKTTALSASLTVASTHKTITYCTALKGVDARELPILQAKARSTYADVRGWSQAGTVAFREVPSGCDFTLWLTASQLMPTFGEICDSTWSCRVGPNVVVNYDRWQHASPAWNEYGGTLSNYREMVINHETGHWLGFNHALCPGPGQQAPVMQQQSINLQGCSFNPWPTTGELQVNRQTLGL
jgi:hypothetical protein